MNSIVRRLLPACLFWMAVFTCSASAQAQDAGVNAVVSARTAITVLDSTKEQDGLVGSVRRVKTETAKIELRDGRPVEGAPQLVELTTYGINGKRIENTSYPLGGGVVGKEEYKYDEHGNITEMTVRDDHGAIVSREAYNYEFDELGNWTKMVTNLVVFENGELKREPVEVTYRTVTYYFDDTVAKIVEGPKLPEAVAVHVTDQPVMELGALANPEPSVPIEDEPPPLFKPIKSVESVAPDANALFLAGRDFLNLHKDREAIKAFKDSIKLNPNVAEVHYGLGFSNFRLGRFRDAVDAFKKAVALEPKMAKAHYGLSLACQELGMTQQLMEQYRILETLDKTLAKKLVQTFPQFNFSCRAIQGCP
jgi:tetratricopeptide repeat protein